MSRQDNGSRLAGRSLIEDLRRGTSLRRDLIEDSERTLAGVVNGILMLGGTLSLLPLLFFGTVAPVHRPLLSALAVFGVVLGVASLRLINWRHVPTGFFIGFSLISVAMVAIVIWGSGGENSPARSYLVISILFTAWFYPVRVAGFFLLLNILANAAPLVYEHNGGTTDDWLRVFFSTSVFMLVGGSISCGRTLMWLHRKRADRLAAQDRAMRAINTAVVEGADAVETYLSAAREVSELAEGAYSAVLRLDGTERVTLMSVWPPERAGEYGFGSSFAVRGKVVEAMRAGRPLYQPDMRGAPVCDALGFTSGLIAPIPLRGGPTFIIVLSDMHARSSQQYAEELMVVTEPIATAIQSLHDRERLAKQAATDSLTGLANHRVFDAALVTATVAAVESETPLAVALIDVDEFKQINDNAGHEFGDSTLVRLAEAMTSVADPRDTISRTGGDEFAWVMPGACARQACERVEQARELFQRPDGDHRVTISVGISDVSMATEPAALTRLADGALYWSKAQGRAMTRIYDPEAVDDLSESERADRLAQSQTLVGLRALARAIDAKDPVTSQHSDRVAELASRLARVRGWSEERVALLRDAALVHDVGKLAVPDALLTKPGELTDRERLQMSEHVELSVRIVTGVLTPEQLDWIHTHHERPDGHGYPRGLNAEQLSEGGQLLAIANAFDAMTSGRGYSRGLSIEEALEECHLRASTQFSGRAVRALEQVIADPALAAALGRDLEAATALRAAER